MRKKIKALSWEQKGFICHIVAAAIEGNNLSLPEDVYQSDRGMESGPNMLADLIEYLNKEDLFEERDDEGNTLSDSAAKGSE